MRVFTCLLCLMLFTKSVLAVENSLKAHNHMGVIPIYLLSLGAIGWMVHEGGRNPEHARYYYATGMLVSSTQLDNDIGKSVFAVSTAMTLTNQYYTNNPPEKSIQSRQANLSVFIVGSIVTALTINAWVEDNTDSQNKLSVIPSITEQSYGINLNYKF